VPEYSIEKSRIPEDKPGGDHYQPSPSYFQTLKKAPDGSDEKFTGKPSEHRYSRYGEKESSKGKKGSSEEDSGSSEDERSGSPSEYSYDKQRGSEEDGSAEQEGKPTEYNFSSSKKEPTKTYSYYTTDPPVNYYYETDNNVCRKLNIFTFSRTFKSTQISFFLLFFKYCSQMYNLIISF